MEDRKYFEVDRISISILAVRFDLLLFAHASSSGYVYMYSTHLGIEASKNIHTHRTHIF